MSIIDTIGGLFTGDTYYPDNPKREHRANEAAADCQRLTAQLSELAPQIKEEFRQLNSSIAEAYGDPANLPSDAKPEEIKFGQWGVDVAQIVAPIVGGMVVSTALTTAATSYLVGAGEIGAAGLAELVGLPAAFELGIGAVAGVAVVGIAFGIGAISGDVKRSKLQDAIRGGVASRLKLQTAYLVNSQLSQSIYSMIAGVNALKEAGANSAAVTESLRRMAASVHNHLDAIDDQGAQEVLSALDRGRGSWTNEG